MGQWAVSEQVAAVGSTTRCVCVRARAPTSPGWVLIYISVCQPFFHYTPLRKIFRPVFPKSHSPYESHYYNRLYVCLCTEALGRVTNHWQNRLFLPPPQEPVFIPIKNAWSTRSFHMSAQALHLSPATSHHRCKGAVSPVSISMYLGGSVLSYSLV